MAQSPTSKAQLRLAHRLWLGSYQGVLATHSAAQPGYPFGSLVPFCHGHDGLPLLLLSDLAQHTRNLQADPSSSLILIERGEGDVQSLGRLTCLARTEPAGPLPPATLERYFRYFPASRPYFETLNFHFYRVRPERFYFVGGFGSARWLDVGQIVPSQSLTADEEEQLLSKSNERLNAQMQTADASPEKAVTVIGADFQGVDLMTGHLLSRLMFEEPLATSEAISEHLKTLFKPAQDRPSPEV